MKKIISFMLIIATLVLATGCTSSKPGDTTFLNFNWGMSIKDVMRSAPKNFELEENPYSDETNEVIIYNITGNTDSIFTSVDIPGTNKISAYFYFDENKLNSIYIQYLSSIGSKALGESVNNYIEGNYGKACLKNIYDTSSYYDYWSETALLTFYDSYDKEVGFGLEPINKGIPDGMSEKVYNLGKDAYEKLLLYFKNECSQVELQEEIENIKNSLEGIQDIANDNYESVNYDIYSMILSCSIDLSYVPDNNVLFENLLNSINELALALNLEPYIPD